MKTHDPLLVRQLKAIQKIVEDETWLEGERRGCAVSRADRIVRENVCRVVLRIGQQLREAGGEPGGRRLTSEPGGMERRSRAA